MNVDHDALAVRAVRAHLARKVGDGRIAVMVVDVVHVRAHGPPQYAHGVHGAAILRYLVALALDLVDVHLDAFVVAREHHDVDQDDGEHDVVEHSRLEHEVIERRATAGEMARWRRHPQAEEVATAATADLVAGEPLRELLCARLEALGTPVGEAQQRARELVRRRPRLGARHLR